MKICMYDRDIKVMKMVDIGLDFFEGIVRSFEVIWFSDSKWFVYFRIFDIGNSVIYVYDILEGKLY